MGKNLFVDEVSFIFEQISSAVQNDAASIPLHAPELSKLELDYVTKCINSGWVSSVGEFVTEFERDICKKVGCQNAIAMSSGTSALQIALISCGIKNGEEVLLPALTFVATANAIVHAGAIPHFVDSEYATLGVCPKSLREHLEMTTFNSSGRTLNKKSGNAISAIIPMHTFGHPVDIDPIMDIAEEFNLRVIEDAAEALGSRYKNKFCGTFGEVGMLSFNGNKIITTGGGGALITNNEELAKRARHISTTAKLPHKFEYYHDEVAYNFRMPNLNAALGCAQLSRLDDFLLRKRKIFNIYDDIFSNCEAISLFQEPNNCISNYWLNSILLEHEFSSDRDWILNIASDLGIQCRPVWKLLNELPMFLKNPRANLENAQSIASRLINLPSGPGLLS